MWRRFAVKIARGKPFCCLLLLTFPASEEKWAERWRKGRKHFKLDSSCFLLLYSRLQIYALCTTNLASVTSHWPSIWALFWWGLVRPPMLVGAHTHTHTSRRVDCTYFRLFCGNVLLLYYPPPPPPPPLEKKKNPLHCGLARTYKKGKEKERLALIRRGEAGGGGRGERKRGRSRGLEINEWLLGSLVVDFATSPNVTASTQKWLLQDY